MEFDITRATIFKTLTGSRVYGTSTPESDFDYRGVAVPPPRWFFGYKSQFDQYEGGEDDSVIYDIRKFLKLAADNNPNVVELLYIPRKHWVVTTPLWERLVEARDLFLSQKSYSTFRGYAQAQLKRIQSHRGWLLQGELQEPTRAQFQLPEVDRWTNGHQAGAAFDLLQHFLKEEDIEHMLAEIAKLGAKAEAVALRQKIWDFLTFTLSMAKEEVQNNVERSAMKLLGFDDNLMDRLQREKSYTAAKRHYESWQKWKRERNEKRKELERIAGYDCKHGSHLARLLLMCEDILRDHTIYVECKQADFLRDIREGRVPYDKLMEWAQKMEATLAELKEATTLRHSPDRNAIEELGISIVQDFHNDSRDIVK